MANDQSRRKELLAQYKQTRPEAGVYRIVNSQSDKALLGSTANLSSVRNRMKFAQSTNSPGALDQRLMKDIRQFGINAFSLEVLDVLETRPKMTRAEVLADLAALEALWREKLDPSLLY
jgi:hypothetical protein